MFFNSIMAKFCHEFSLNKNHVVCHLFFHGLKLTTSYFRSKLIKLLPRSLLAKEMCRRLWNFQNFLVLPRRNMKVSTSRENFFKYFLSILQDTAHILIFFRSCYTIFNFINLNNNFT